MRAINIVFATALMVAAAGGVRAQNVVPPQDPTTPLQHQTQAPPPAPPTPSGAANHIAPQAAGRFSFTKVEGGLLRLDSATGHMSFCSPHTVGWACEIVPEDRAALDAEIARLQGELGKLKDEIAKAQPPRPPADLSPPQNPQARGQDDSNLRLPSREEMERARSALERAWQRLVDMISEFQKDLMKKG